MSSYPHPRTYPVPHANGGNGHPVLDQYAKKWNGSMLEAHADNAFGPHGTGVLPHGGHHVPSQPRPVPNQSFHHSQVASSSHGPAGGLAAIPYPRASGAGIHNSPLHPNDPSIINPPVPPPFSSGTQRNHHLKPPVNTHNTGLPSPPPSTGHPSPEQPRAANLPRPSAAPPHSTGNLVCCGTQYGSKFTFDRHRRESRKCPHGDGGRDFRCYECVAKPFGRRNTLQQHVQEVHRVPKDDAKKWVDTWYQRYGAENDYPHAVADLPPAGSMSMRGGGGGGGAWP